MVYKVSCLDCDFVYYGQTDRDLVTRIKEHSRAVRVCDSNSKIAEHANQFGHSMDFNHTTIIDKAQDYRKRRFSCGVAFTERDRMWRTNIPIHIQIACVVFAVSRSVRVFCCVRRSSKPMFFCQLSNQRRLKLFGRNVFFQVLLFEKLIYNSIVSARKFMNIFVKVNSNNKFAEKVIVN